MVVSLKLLQKQSSEPRIHNAVPRVEHDIIIEQVLKELLQWLVIGSVRGMPVAAAKQQPQDSTESTVLAHKSSKVKASSGHTYFLAA